MFDPLEHLIQSFTQFFVELWKADERPEARRFTIGCAVIAFAIIGAIVCYYTFR